MPKLINQGSEKLAEQGDEEISSFRTKKKLKDFFSRYSAARLYYYDVRGKHVYEVTMVRSFKIVIYSRGNSDHQ